MIHGNMLLFNFILYSVYIVLDFSKVFSLLIIIIILFTIQFVICNKYSLVCFIYYHPYLRIEYFYHSFRTDNLSKEGVDILYSLF